MSATWTQSAERSAFAAILALLLAPVVAQGLWRPLVHLFGPAGDAASITGAALAVSGAVVLARRLRARR
ncbi:MAG TPA: hypothetical protein PKW35_15375, partial [Nannocystaceae bacterium]|nr:hypothetical protein [Nannocystaceae bacterium]